MIRVNGLVREYGNLLVLGGLGLKIPDGHVTAVLGPSGCGKTTLLNILSGLDTKYRGTVSGLPSSVSYAFQDGRLLGWATVRRNLEFVAPDPHASRDRIHSLVSMMELNGYEHFTADSLSGGMKQRVVVARALVSNSPLLLLDEPFQSLDHALKMEIVSRTAELVKREKRTVLLVTHDLNDALMLSDRIVILSEKPARVIAEKPVRLSQADRMPGRANFIRMKKELIRYF
jgi:NitT/TauT family transport system ATP-binding protein